MSFVIALIFFIFGCSQIFVTVRAVIKLKHDKKIVPKFIRFSLWYSSAFGLILIFLGFDMIFKWI